MQDSANTPPKTCSMYLPSKFASPSGCVHSCTPYQICISVHFDKLQAVFLCFLDTQHFYSSGPALADYVKIHRLSLCSTYLFHFYPTVHTVWDDRLVCICAQFPWAPFSMSQAHRHCGHGCICLLWCIQGNSHRVPAKSHLSKVAGCIPSKKKGGEYSYLDKMFS